MQVGAAFGQAEFEGVPLRGTSPHSFLEPLQAALHSRSIPVALKPWVPDPETSGKISGIALAARLQLQAPRAHAG